MRRLWNWFLWLLVLSGFPLLAWAGIYMARDTYVFWRYGVEKSAHVVALDHTSSGGKGGTTFYYAIEIGGRVMAAGIIILYVFLIFTGPKTLMAWIRHRRLVIDMK